MILNIPNVLTLMRMVAIPLFVIVYYLPYSWSNQLATGIFILAGVTDWLDGYLARRLNQSSPFGAFLDPVADKLMVAAALVVVVADPLNRSLSMQATLFTIMAIVIIGREITISALREWMAEVGQRASVAVSVVGKFKTTAQMFAVGFLLYREPFSGLPVFRIGEILLYMAAFLTLWSMIAYLRAAWPVLKNGE